MKYKTSPLNLGAVVSVRGSVVDVRFDAHLPSIYSLLHAKEGEIAIEVLAQLDAHRVRGIALTPTEGLAWHGELLCVKELVMRRPNVSNGMDSSSP